MNFFNNELKVKTLPNNPLRIAEGGLRLSGKLTKTSISNKLITVITVVLNGEKNLENTIKSVINQNYDSFEYIIVDGGSTDNTLDIIRKYNSRIDYWVSEPDNGISDAFNKGVCLANGDYINFQGDGDGFVSSDVLEKLFCDVNPLEDIFISARISRVDGNGEVLFTSKHINKFDKKSLLFRMSLPHQGLFTHKSYFQKYGLFDTYNIFSMDYEHLLRAYNNFPKVVTKNIIAARWRADGLGTGRILDIYKEYDKIKRKNKVASCFILNLINYWILFKYYLKKLIKSE